MDIKQIKSHYLDSNTFVVIDESGAIIIDCGAELDDVIEAVGKNKVVGIFLTHGHFDHAINAEKIAEHFGVKIFCHVACKEYLSDPEKNYGTQYDFKIEHFGNFCFLKRSTKFILENFEIECIFLGGHSKSDMCFLLNGHLFVGDIIIGKGVGRFDLFGSDKEQLKNSLEKIKNMNFEVLHSGHGEDESHDEVMKIISVWQKFLKR